MITKRVKVEWDLDGVSLEEAGVPEIVEIPVDGLDDKSVSNYLSYVYGWLVLDWNDYKDKDEEGRGG